MRTLPETLQTIENQIRGYVHNERSFVFADMHIDDVVDLCMHYGVIPVETCAGGVWICKEEDLDDIAHIISLERYASDGVLDDIRAEFLEFEVSKTDIDIDTVMARDTIGHEGYVIKTELIDGTVGSPKDNQRDVSVIEAFARRVM